MAPRVIVVGGGLSGLSAAHTIYLNGGNVLVLDKQAEANFPQPSSVATPQKPPPVSTVPSLVHRSISVSKIASSNFTMIL
ncbi:hypothetical protein BDV06DRAFT_126756 [Aspergillus oleicola]